MSRNESIPWRFSFLYFSLLLYPFIFTFVSKSQCLKYTHCHIINMIFFLIDIQIIRFVKFIYLYYFYCRSELYSEYVMFNKTIMHTWFVFFRFDISYYNTYLCYQKYLHGDHYLDRFFESVYFMRDCLSEIHFLLYFFLWVDRCDYTVDWRT